MKYTKNITNKLKLIGFELELDSNDLPKESVDDILHYEVWSKGCIEVTVEHSPGKIVLVCLRDYDDYLNIKSIQDLELLSNLLTVKKIKS